MYQREAIIHSRANTSDKVRTVEVITHNGNNNVVVMYEGKKCTAVDNPFSGYLYVDDIYGVISDNTVGA